MKFKAIIILLSFSLFSCSYLPYKKNLNVSFPEEDLLPKITLYSEALIKLGEMTKIFNTKKIYIQSKNLGDNTGISRSTGGEIPFDITEMIKSAVNRIGGNIIFVPYDPSYILNQKTLGITKLEDMVKPDVIVSGGITEFDRSLEVIDNVFDTGLDFGDEIDEDINVGFDIRTKKAQSISSITLDLNLVDFNTMAMIPQMQAINTIRVFKAKKDTSLGFTLFGPSLGLRGSIKKIQGRHAAIRVLVEMSILEIIGKYLGLPYWKCIEGAKPDPIVLNNIKNTFCELSLNNKIKMIQKLLKLYGFDDIEENGILDIKTELAIVMFQKSYNLSYAHISEKLYKMLFLNVPVFG